MTDAESGQGTSRKVGACPNHGFIFDEDVEFNFPQAARCSDCGEELEKCFVADAEEVAELAK